jgi:hypothetical protein
VPTFLTTRKMPRALAARIEARIRSRRAAHGRTLAPLVVSVLRFGALGIVIALATLWVMARQQDRLRLEQRRAELLDSVEKQAAQLTEDDLGTTARVEEWLVRFSGPYAGDRVAAELRAPGALSSTLARGAIYARAELEMFTSVPAIRAHAPDWRKDPFLLCLVDPPESRTEKAQLRKVLAAYAGGAQVETPTAHVRLLHEAQQGLPFLAPAWQNTLRAANSQAELDRLQRAFEHAPIEAAKRAARTRLLLVAMDERGDGRGPIELDGAHPHPVRVGLVDLGSQKVLLRLRRSVDPKWISPARRAEYARGLDGCALALDVRDSVAGPPAEATGAHEDAAPSAR